MGARFKQVPEAERANEQLRPKAKKPGSMLLDGQESSELRQESSKLTDVRGLIDELAMFARCNTVWWL